MLDGKGRSERRVERVEDNLRKIHDHRRLEQSKVNRTLFDSCSPSDFPLVHFTRLDCECSGHMIRKHTLMDISRVATQEHLMLEIHMKMDFFYILKGIKKNKSDDEPEMPI